MKRDLQLNEWVIISYKPETLNDIHIVQNEFNKDLIHINKDKCPNLIESLESYEWITDNDGREIPNKRSGDHESDSLSGGVINKNRIKPNKNKNKKKKNESGNNNRSDLLRPDNLIVPDGLIRQFN
ncbi:MAG: hypothetical protein LBT10_01110 [Methanobrevibacter sp.]|jgi:hypothetical protein|nr:hypothetical protein [Methanobrevibacter sp.]